MLDTPWILDIDTTVKPLYGKQEGAVVSYNPKKPGRPSHSYHTYLMAGLRLVLGVEVKAGNKHTGSQSALGAYFRRMCSRMDKPKAVTAAAHKLARLIYNMLTNGEEYTDQGQDYFEERYRQRVLHSLSVRAEKLVANEQPA